MKHIKILIIVIILLVLLLVVYAVAEKLSKPNLDNFGCSVPSIINNISAFNLKESTLKFTPACIVHDYCYRCGSCTYTKSKRDCDGQFKENMLAACVNGNDSLKCNKKARLYHFAVKYFGFTAYKTKSVCIKHEYNTPEQ